MRVLDCILVVLLLCRCYGGYKSPRRPEFPSGRIFWGSSAFFLWIGAYAGLTAPQSDVGGRVRMSLLIIEESSEAGHA